MEKFNSTLYFDTINKVVKNAIKHQITNIEEIVITKSELEMIEKNDDLEYRKVLFMFFVISKVIFLIRKSKYVNYKASQIKRVSNLNCKTDIYKILNEMNDNQTIKSCTTGGRKFNLDLDFTGEPIIVVKDYENIGLYYLNYINGGYLECEECGSMFKKSSTNQKFCKKCGTYKKMEFKNIICEVCAKKVLVNSKANNRTKCNKCISDDKKRYKREWKERQKVEQSN